MSSHGFTRREFLKKCAAAGVGGLVLSNQALKVSLSAGRPNIIFIFADDLGWGDLGCYGHPNIKTPHLDKLAQQGTLFKQFYVCGSVCSPSRAAIMTGHFPARHRIHGHFASVEQNQSRGMPNYLDPQVTTITRLFKQAGYATGHFGKWHLGGSSDAPDPGAYGIDDHRTTNSNGPTWDTELYEPYFRAQSTGLIVDEAIRFIEANQASPFYLNVWTLVPHATLHPTEGQMAPYSKFGPQNVPYKGAMQIYYASVTNLDEQIGRLLDRLDQLGLAENTVVIFSSDNGPEDIHSRNASHSGVGDAGPFRGRKRSIYEGGVREPFIVRWPGHIPAGRTDEISVIAGVDFLPTVCELAGVQVPAGLNPDGEDVSDILLATSRPRTKPIMWEWRFNITGHIINQSPMLAIRDGDWKLLMNPDRSRVELYNIPKDLTELNNLADSQSQIVQNLSSQLLTWKATLPN